MPLELTRLVAERSVARRRKKRGRRGFVAAGGVLAALVAAAVAWAILGGEPAATPAADVTNVTDVERPDDGGDGRAEADGVGPLTVAAPEPPAYELPADEKALLAGYSRELRLDGLEMLASGDVDAAEKWLQNYLAAPTDGRDDQAVLALGVVYLTRGDVRSAETVLADLVRQRPDSLRSGDGYYLLGKVRASEGRLDEAEEAFLEAVRVYEKSHGGRRSAKRLADELYEKHVAGYPKRTEWERIRDLYSIAIRGLVSPGAEGAQHSDGLPPDWDRAKIVSRLDELNDWVIFTPHARPREGYPTNVCFHRVVRGDTLGGIAKHYGVAVGSLRRLNGIPADSHVIRPGQELKILRGRTEILVDTRELIMTVWVDGRFLREYRVGTGREGRTPIGKFRIASRLIDPDWTPPGQEEILFGDPRNILGTRWLGFSKSAFGNGYGVHGSRLRDDIWEGVGERASNGCVRMRNPDVEELFDFAPIGTEVVIYE